METIPINKQIDEYVGDFGNRLFNPFGKHLGVALGADMTTALSSLNGLKSEIGDLICKQKLDWKMVLLLDL